MREFGTFHRGIRIFFEIELLEVKVRNCVTRMKMSRRREVGGGGGDNLGACHAVP